MNAWLTKLYETFIETGHYNLIIEGFKNTILITLGALLIGVVIGMIIAVVKYFAEDVKALKPLAYICDFYVTAVRGIPVVVLLLIFYFIVIASAEAGRSLGMSKLQATRKIILPQALRYILPAIGNEMIALLKETAVAGYVAVVDLTRAGNLVRNNTYDAVNPLMCVAIIYLVLVVLLSQLLKVVEGRLNKK